MRAPLPPDETGRLAALSAQKILDSAPERSFDDIARLAQLICGVPIALVTLVDKDRQWFKARLGIELEEIPRDVSFCAHALGSRSPLIVPDTHDDPRFSDNPMVTADPSLRFYAGVPLFVDDATAAVGTLCVLDRVPRTLGPEQLEALEALARRVETEMRLRRDAVTTRREGRAKPSSAQRSTASEIATGDVVGGRYEIVRLIGSGGMGRVYEAIDRTASARVALKVMSSMAVSSEEAVERFTREAQALLRLASVHVARFVDAGNLEDGAPYIVLEHLIGRDLSGEDTARFGAARAVDLAIQACDGVATAHEAGVIHRDLKPANLFLAESSDGTTTLKVLDFGIAKLTAEDPSSAPADARAPLTEAANLLGSPRYMSPEQLLSSRDVDASTDIWALGVVLYELLTGSHPFGGDSVTEICASVFTKKPRPMREHVAELPAALDAVVMRCLARDKGDRWPSARALATALTPFR